MTKKISLAQINTAIQALKNGDMIAIHDHENRENEVDLVIAGQFTTEQHINFMLTHARGIVCAAIGHKIQHQFALTMQPTRGTAIHRCPFTISVDAANNITTGTSAADRAVTAQTLANPSNNPSDIVTPGHMFPLVARPQGLSKRQGHTEASVTMCQLAKLQPCAIICEILNEDGSMARPQATLDLLSAYDIPLISIQQIMEHTNHE